MKLDYGNITTEQRLLINSALYDGFHQTIYENGVPQWNLNPKVKLFDTDLYDIKIDDNNRPYCEFNENFNDWFEFVYRSSLTQKLVDEAKLELGIN